MTTLQTSQQAIGDVHCLNCGRTLAELVHNPDDGYRLQPTVNQSTVQVVVAGRRLLRCRRCGGRAFVELREETPIEEVPSSPVEVAEEESVTRYPTKERRSAPQIGWRVGQADRSHRREGSRALAS
jgi:DNA-directed RNA polymerase subunit RPC12/RpoP